MAGPATRLTRQSRLRMQHMARPPVCASQGLHVNFSCLLAVRQAHGFAFGKSDVFMLCGMTLDSKAGNKEVDGRPAITPCETVRLRLLCLPMQQCAALQRSRHRCHRSHNAAALCTSRWRPAV
jgi:hypothetical protein